MSVPNSLTADHGQSVSTLARSQRMRIGGSLLLIAFAVACAYSNSLSGPFIMDDIESIPENPSIRRLWPPGEVLTGARFATVIGRPLLNLSLAIDYKLHGTTVRSYHLSNIVAHILVGWALFGVIHRTLRLSRYFERFSPLGAIGFALAVALLWSLHPLTTGAVTYIVQRGEVLAAFWSLSTLYCSIRGADAASSRPRLWNGLAVVCCLVGVCTKETVSTAPLVVLLYDTTFLAGSWKESLRRRRGMYAGLFGTWIVLAILMKSSGGRSSTAGLGYGMDPLSYAMSQFGYVLTYLKRSVWPQGLVFDYGDALATTFDEIFYPAMAILVLLILLLVAGRRWPAVGFLGTAALLILAPTSTVIPLVTQTAAEHRMYLPLAGIVTIIVLAGYGLAEKLVKAESSRSKVLVIGCVVLAIVLGVLTWQRNRVYQTEEALWADTVAQRPASARAHNNLGRVYLEQRKPAARKELETAIRLKAKPEMWHNLGLACLQQRDFPAALASLNEAIGLQPNHAASYLARSQVYGQLRNDRAELADLNRAIELDPGNGEAYLRRAFLRADQEKYEDAWKDLQAAVQRGAQAPPSFMEQLRQVRGVPQAP